MSSSNTTNFYKPSLSRSTRYQHITNSRTMFNCAIFAASIFDTRRTGIRIHSPNPSDELALGFLRRIKRHIFAQSVVCAETERAHDGSFAVILFIGVKVGNIGKSVE